MKSEGIILVGVLGFCALFGAGVSQVLAPVAQSVESMINDSSTETVTAETDESLRDALAVRYPNAVISDEALDSLSCGEETSWLGNKECYDGPTDAAKRYGKAMIAMEQGKPPVYVQLVSMPAGAFLLK